MLRQISSFLLLATCVQYSLQICHNNVCQEDDKCSANAQCPSGYECETVCGYCNPIPGYCSSNNMCDHFDEVCDTASNPYTTCFWCDNDNTCKPGCISNTNCEAGYQCNNHLCVESSSCPDNAYCNQGLTEVCDIESSPYTQCMYCEGGDCLPGCLADVNCPHGYTCVEHKCTAQAGKTLVDSITIKTSSCTGCTSEGLTAVLMGEKVPGFPDGIPCATNTLDHAGVTDFGDGGAARFDGTLNGAQNDEEESMIGGCFRAPLNNQLTTGTLIWKGDGTWNPASVCVDWLYNEVFANECDLTKVAGKDNQFELVNCHELAPDTKCT